MHIRKAYLQLYKDENDCGTNDAKGFKIAWCVTHCSIYNLDRSMPFRDACVNMGMDETESSLNPRYIRKTSECQALELWGIVIFKNSNGFKDKNGGFLTSLVSGWIYICQQHNGSVKYYYNNNKKLMITSWTNQSSCIHVCCYRLTFKCVMWFPKICPSNIRL